LARERSCAKPENSNLADARTPKEGSSQRLCCWSSTVSPCPPLSVQTLRSSPQLGQSFSRVSSSSAAFRVWCDQVRLSCAMVLPSCTYRVLMAELSARLAPYIRHSYKCNPIVWAISMPSTSMCGLEASAAYRRPSVRNSHGGYGRQALCLRMRNCDDGWSIMRDSKRYAARGVRV
jgi:hypothetical protein